MGSTAFDGRCCLQPQPGGISSPFLGTETHVLKHFSYSKLCKTIPLLMINTSPSYLGIHGIILISFFGCFSTRPLLDVFNSNSADSTKLFSFCASLSLLTQHLQDHKLLSPCWGNDLVTSVTLNINTAAINSVL